MYRAREDPQSGWYEISMSAWHGGTAVSRKPVTSEYSDYFQRRELYCLRWEYIGVIWLLPRIQAYVRILLGVYRIFSVYYAFLSQTLTVKHILLIQA